MHEKIYIKRCLDEIEQKLKWQSRDKWVYEDFKQLQELIFDASSIQLSVHTLERLYGKLKTQDNYNPQTETKNALAIFLGYKSWNQYKSENKVDIRENSPLNLTVNTGNKELNADDWREDRRSASEYIISTGVAVRRFTKKKLYLTSALVICCIGLALFYFLVRSTLKNVPSPALLVTNPYGRVPHTAKFIYDNPKRNALQVDFGEGEPWTMQEEQSTFFKTYMRPGIYQVSLMDDKGIVARSRVFIDTDGWQGYTYKTYEDNRTRQLLPASSLRLTGELYTSPDLVNNTIRKQIYFVEDNLVRKFGVDGDNLTFDTRFKSSVQHGGTLCNDMWFKLTGMRGILKMHFLAPGCSGYTQMIYGEQNLDGRNEDLAAFTRDFTDWKTARMTVVNKQVSIYFDNKLIYRTSYKTPIGEIMAISITSKGSGETDYVKLYDGKMKLAFADDFK